jgi:hypothetical protein
MPVAAPSAPSDDDLGLRPGAKHATGASEILSFFAGTKIPRRRSRASGHDVRFANVAAIDRLLDDVRFARPPEAD